MPTHTTAAHHTPRPCDDHDALRELIAQNLATDSSQPSACDW
ncbi:MAG: hypothetical protein ACRDRR_21970 [Pseudonocardiaceae bacterium]